MIENPYANKHGDLNEIRAHVWGCGEQAGQSNAREAMRCETCGWLAELPSGLYCKGPSAKAIDYIDEPQNFGCIHHQPKTT